MEAEKQLSIMGFQEWGGLFLEVRAKMPSPTCCYPDRFTEGIREEKDLGHPVSVSVCVPVRVCACVNLSRANQLHQ